MRGFYLFCLACALALPSARAAAPVATSAAASAQAPVAGPVSAIPMMTVVDRVHGAAYRWWQGEDDLGTKYLAQLARIFHDALYAEFAKQGFFAIRPSSVTAMMVPEALRSERAANEGVGAIGDYFRAAIVVVGETRLRESQEAAGAFQVSLRLSALQARGGRSIADVTRTFESAPGSFEAVVRTRLAAAYPESAKDLASQMNEYWQKGTLGGNAIQLAVHGRLSPKQLDLFKRELLASVREAKAARERLFEPGQVTLELESGSTIAQLSDRLRAAQLPGFQSRVTAVTDKLISLEVTAR